MNRKIGYVSLIAPSYNEANDYYIRALDFKLLEDTDFGDVKQWIVINPGQSEGTGLVLAEAKTDEEKAAIYEEYRKQGENIICEDVTGTITLPMGIEPFFLRYQMTDLF